MGKTKVETRSKLKSLGLFNGLKEMFWNNDEDKIDKKAQRRFEQNLDAIMSKSENKNEMSEVKAYKDKQRAEVDITKTTYNTKNTKGRSKLQGREHE